MFHLQPWQFLDIPSWKLKTPAVLDLISIIIFCVILVFCIVLLTFRMVCCCWWSVDCCCRSIFHLGMEGGCECTLARMERFGIPTGNWWSLCLPLMACEKVGSPEITSVRSQEVDGASLPWSLVLYWANLSELAVSNIFILNPAWGNDPIWLQSYFSNGLKPPASYLLGVLSCFDPGIADSPTWCLVLDFSVSLLSPSPIGMADVVIQKDGEGETHAKSP